MVPSPNAQAYATTVPSTSVDPEASNAHASPVHAGVKDAVGGTFPAGAVTVTPSTTAPVAVPSSVTVRVTTYVPGSA